MRIVYTTEDAYIAFVAGRMTRDEFFAVCEYNAEVEREASGISSGETRRRDQPEWAEQYTSEH